MVSPTLLSVFGIPVIVLNPIYNPEGGVYPNLKGPFLKNFF
jgi:hypothetical protein